MTGCPISMVLSKGSGTAFNDCNKNLVVARDILDALSGKWKMKIILALLKIERRRFKELQNDVNGISSKVLSVVLKDLEVNHIVIRTAIDTAPPTVEYELSAYGKSIKQAIMEFIKLGAKHRNEVIGDRQNIDFI